MIRDLDFGAVTMAEVSTRSATRARLREMVAASRVGDRLPSERQLSVRWGAARMTIRRATDALIAEGLVERRHGSGTYVAPKPFARLLGLTSFTQDMRDRGLAPGSRLLAFEALPADGSIARRLQIADDARTIRFTRLRLADGDPMAVETVWIPAAIVPGLGPTDLNGSLYELLAERHGVVMGSASVTIEPILPDVTTREHLGIPAQQACLRLHMVDRDARGRVIMIADCVYRGDRYQLSAEISGAAFPGLGQWTR
jgi:DNA-binding GntR family transcriptional regulator